MEEYRELEALYKSSFADSDAYVDYFFSHKFRPDRVVTLREDSGRVISALHLIERRILLSGRSFRCPFIVAAATLPEFRGMGNFEKVMLQTLYLLNETGVVLTELFPVNHRYYLKYGFVNAGKLSVYKVPPRRVSGGEGSIRARPSTLETRGRDVETMFWLYHRFLARGGLSRSESAGEAENAGGAESTGEAGSTDADPEFAGCDGAADRSKQDFSDRIEELEADGGRAALLLQEDRPVGYFFDEGDGSCSELVMEDYSQIEEAGALCGMSVTLPLWAGRGRVLPGNQARIVNVRKLLSLLRFDRKVCQAIRIKVSDRLLCHNNVTLSLVIAQGEVLVRPCREWDFEVTVEELTSLVFGSFALYRNELPPKLCEIFGEKNNICFDKF